MLSARLRPITAIPTTPICCLDITYSCQVWIRQRILPGDTKCKHVNLKFIAMNSSHVNFLSRLFNLKCTFRKTFQTKKCYAAGHTELPSELIAIYTFSDRLQFQQTFKTCLRNMYITLFRCHRKCLLNNVLLSF